MILTLIVLVSIASVIGGVTVAGAFLFFPEGTRKSIIPWLLSYAAGTLLGTAFLGMLPRALHAVETVSVMRMVLVGMVVFFALEKMVIWHHCHNAVCEEHKAAGSLILIGDALHNFIDGLVLATAFLVSISLGIATAVAIIAHEIPQEVGDVAILLHSGYSRGRAFLVNVASGLTLVLGALIGCKAFTIAEPFIPYILALAAASFIYIATVDLVPKLHQRLRISEGIGQLVLLLAGIGTIMLFTRHLH